MIFKIYFTLNQLHIGRLKFKSSPFLQIFTAFRNTSNTQESVFSPFYRTNDLEGGTWHRVPNNTDSYTWPNFANYNNNNQRKMRKETVYDLIDLAITYSKTLSQFLTSQEKLEVVHMAINKREVLMIDILIKYTKCCKCLLSFATKIRDIYQTMTIYEIFHAEQQTRNFVSNTSYYRIV